MSLPLNCSIWLFVQTPKLISLFLSSTKTTKKQVQLLCPGRNRLPQAVSVVEAMVDLSAAAAVHHRRGARSARHSDRLRIHPVDAVRVRRLRLLVSDSVSAVLQD